jgi:GNAT superfamily N-acetyltransferase
MTTDDFAIRAAREADLPTVRQLLVAAHLPTDGLEEQFGDGYAIAESNGTAIGAEGIEVYGDAGLLRSAVVDADWRGRGVGDALTQDRLRWAAARGLARGLAPHDDGGRLLPAVWLCTCGAGRCPGADAGVARVRRGLPGLCHCHATSPRLRHRCLTILRRRTAPPDPAAMQRAARSAARTAPPFSMRPLR